MKTKESYQSYQRHVTVVLWASPFPIAFIPWSPILLFLNLYKTKPNLSQRFYKLPSLRKNIHKKDRELLKLYTINFNSLTAILRIAYILYHSNSFRLLVNKRKKVPINYWDHYRDWHNPIEIHTLVFIRWYERLINTIENIKMTQNRLSYLQTLVLTVYLLHQDCSTIHTCSFIYIYIYYYQFLLIQYALLFQQTEIFPHSKK